MLKVQPTLLQVFSPREMMMVYLPEVKHVLINALIEDERVVSSVSIHPRFLCKTEITTTSIFSWFVACEVTWMYTLFSILFKPICAPLIPTRWLTFTQCYNKSQYLTSNWLQALFFKKKFQVSIILECFNYVSFMLQLIWTSTSITRKVLIVNNVNMNLWIDLHFLIRHLLNIHE